MLGPVKRGGFWATPRVVGVVVMGDMLVVVGSSGVRLIPVGRCESGIVGE